MYSSFINFRFQNRKMNNLWNNKGSERRQRVPLKRKGHNYIPQNDASKECCEK